MEGFHLLKDLVQPNDYMVKVDLKDAYFSVPVHLDYRYLLRFRWAGKLYQFQCMPFGLGLEEFKAHSTKGATTLKAAAWIKGITHKE